MIRKNIVKRNRVYKSRKNKMNKFDRTMIRRIVVVLQCAVIFISFMPGMTFALEDQPELMIEADDLVDADQETEFQSGSLADADALLEDYMERCLNEELGIAQPVSGMRKAAGIRRRNNLNENEKYIYDSLKSYIDRAAAGKESSAIIDIDVDSIFRPYFTPSDGYNVITSSSLGIKSPVCVKKTVNGRTTWPFSDEAKEKLYDFNKVINALMADEPYAFYWYDKTAGLAQRIDGQLIDTSGDSSDFYILETKTPMLEVSFTVSEDYRNGNDGYSIDTAKTGAASRAAVNAAGIIKANASASDYKKLVAYKEKICALTSYNSKVAGSQSYPYGDPWQMIYVFDGDSSTNVVCEGYSKAFQYLCDHTDFNNDIKCDSVTGTMQGGISSGGHMWNILHMDDGRNYIADITNSDTGTVGSEGGVFISPAMAGGSVAKGYMFDVYHNGRTDGIADLSYIYDRDTLELFLESELTLSKIVYGNSSGGTGNSSGGTGNSSGGTGNSSGGTGSSSGGTGNSSGGANNPPAAVISPAMTNISYVWSKDHRRCTARGTWTASGKTVKEEAKVSRAVKVPASCLKAGTTTYTAKFSNKYFKTQKKDVKDIPAFGGHMWDGGTVITPAAEGVIGMMVYNCTRCGVSRTEAIPAIVYPADLPKVKITKPKAGKRKVTVKWKKISKKNRKKIQGIEIQIAADPGFTDIIQTATGSKKKTSKVIKGLEPKKKYYIRIRAYINAADGKHVSYWKSKSVKVK